MRIAVLLTGRIYTPDYDTTINRLKSLFRVHKTMYFISLNGTCHLNNEARSEDYNPQDHKVFTENFIQDLHIPNECISIQDLQVPSYIYNFKKKEETKYFNVYSMFFHNKMCFSLLEKYTKKHNIAFDIVLKYRTDIIFKEPIQFEECDLGTLYIPIGYNFGGVNDQVAYGDLDTMRVYCSCIDYLKDVCDNGVLFHPETILNTHLLHRQMNIVRFPFSYRIK